MHSVKQAIALFRQTILPVVEQCNPASVPVAADGVDASVLHAEATPGAECKPDLQRSATATAKAAAESEKDRDNDQAGLDNSHENHGEAAPSDHEQQPDGLSTSTAYERFTAGKYTCKRLEEISRLLNKMCRESDPQFVKIGRDLSIVTRDVRKLTDTVRHAVTLIKNNEGEQTSLARTEELVQSIFATLTEERKIIDNDAVQVNQLVSQIFQCQRIREMIDRINSLFRIVRINIRIQCSARGLNDEIFEGVSDDLDHLSKTLHQITKQILRDINQGTKSLINLEKSINEHIESIDNVFQMTKTIVSKAFHDIRQLMHGAETMIRSADTVSTEVAEKVGQVVVSIQFHDSLSQRVEHILQAFDDINTLCGHDQDTITDEHLGTAFIILDLQLRQLVHISSEVKLVRERIEADFIAIESAVAGMDMILHDKQFREVGPQQFLGSLFTSLEGTLKELNVLLAEGNTMLRQIETAAGETRVIAANLLDLQKNVTEIREETRVQAVNTIIMASNLGHQGKTIEVLAKEIQSLSDKSSVLADDVEAMQLAVSTTVEELIANTSQKESHTGGGSDLAGEINTIKQSFGAIMKIVTEITRQIETSATHIKTTRKQLVFLDSLESALDYLVQNLNKTCDRLAPWKEKGTHDSEEIEQLVERYSMAQERMIHMFDRVNTRHDDEEDDNNLLF